MREQRNSVGNLLFYGDFMNKIPIIFLVCFTVFITNINGDWKLVDGPYGGIVTSLAVCGGKVFAGTFGGGIFVSSDSGNSWLPSNSGPAKGYITALHNKNNLLIVGTYGGSAALSNDNGDTWSDILLSCSDIQSITTLDNTIFFGTIPFIVHNYIIPECWSDFSWPDAIGGGLFFSQDNGKTCSGIPISNLPFQVIYGLTTCGNTVIAALAGGGRDTVFSSTSASGPWAKKSNLPTIYSLETYDTTVYTGTRDGIFFSIDLGLTWERKANANFSGPVHIAGATLFITDTSGSYYSHDFGNSWNRINKSQSDFKIKDVVKIGPRYIACTAKGVFISTDSNSIFKPSNNGLAAANVNAVFNFRNTLFAGSGIIDYGYYTGNGGNGIFFSSDSGKSWDTTKSNISRQSIRAFSAGGDTLYAFTDSVKLFSMDTGRTWDSLLKETFQNKIPPVITSNGDILKAVERIIGSYGPPTPWKIELSADAGLSWNEIAIPQEMKKQSFIMYSLSTKWDNLFVTSNLGVFLTTDKGTTWTNLNNNLLNKQVRSLTFTDQDLFAATDAGIWRRPLSELPLAASPPINAKQKTYGITMHGNTQFSYSLSREAMVSTEIFDMRGKLVWGTAAKKQASGTYSMGLPSNSLPAGNYILCLNAGTEKFSRKFVVLR
jgi:photosystem II stability/assembly factor-like uncharacterized protein